MCGVEFGSFGYTTKDLNYYWDGKDESEYVELDLKTSTLPQFQIRGYNCSNRTVKYLTGDYAAFSVEFLFVRSINYYVAQVYTPSILVVVIGMYFSIDFILNLPPVL